MIYKRRQREAASLDLHALSGEREGGRISALHRSHAATTSSKGPIFFISRKHSAVTFTNNMRSIVEEGHAEVLESHNSSCWRIWGHKQAKPLRATAAHMPCRPGSHQAL